MAEKFHESEEKSPDQKWKDLLTQLGAGELVVGEDKTIPFEDGSEISIAGPRESYDEDSHGNKLSFGGIDPAEILVRGGVDSEAAKKIIECGAKVDKDGCVDF